ncbi:MAG: HAMP domain-containing sensor histidine kinase, partial [Gemmatimonadaceae bacterium]
NAVVVRAVSANATRADHQAAVDLLASRRLPADTATFAAQLIVDASGIRSMVAGKAPTGADSTALGATMAQATQRDSLTIGVPYSTGNNMWYWTVVPVATDNSKRGFIAEQRRIRANPTIDQQLKGITGQDISMYYAAIGADVWTGLGGVPIAPKFDVSALPDSFHITTQAGESLLGVKLKLKGTSWFLVFTINEDAVTSRSTIFLRRMLGIGTALLLVAMLAAWWVSRRVTQPLKSLAIAARQVARGNFSTREPVRTNDELGELARAFNGMAERIGESHALLRDRIQESEALASQLQQASAAKSEFLAMMSHELRTPLSAIAGYAEILQLGMRGELNDAQRLDLSRIQANQVHLLRIINDILDLAQVESGQLMVTTQPVALRDAVGDLDPIIRPLIAEKKIRYSVQEDLLPLSVVAERDRLTQVLVNLVANATRFTKEGGEISLHASHEGSMLRLHVTDSGIGIAAEKHDAIFQPFVQVDSGPSRRAQGTGLGLAISRKIVEAMGGTLSVTSVLGVGSTFTLELQQVTVALDETAVRGDERHERTIHAERRAHAMS